MGVATDTHGRSASGSDPSGRPDPCWATLLEGAPYPAALWSGADLRFSWANRRFLEMLWESGSSFDVLGLPRRGFLSDAEMAVRFQDAAYTGQPHTEHSYEYRTPAGQQSWWRLTFLPVPARLGDPYDVLFTAVDVTADHLVSVGERRRREDLASAEGLVQRTILSTLDADEILQRALIESTEAYGADWGWIALREVDCWVFRNVHGWPVDSIGRGFADTELSLPRLAAEAGDVVVAPSPGMASERGRELMGRYDIGAFLLVPLYAKGEIKGVMGFCWNEPEPLGDAHLELGRKLSLAVTLGLENARTYGAERRIAQTLQSAFFALPSSVRGLEFAHLYHSASGGARVGGDFYDLVQVAPGKVGVVIGDVGGSGVDASAAASLVRSALHVHALEASSPRRVLTATNDVIVRSLAEGTSASAFFGMLDVVDGAFAYCSAGHPRPVLVPAAGTPRLLRTADAILGTQSAPSYAEDVTSLDVGDVLLLYTDGLTCARDERGEEFGSERLLESVLRASDVAVGQLPESVFLDAFSFADGKLADDVAILALRRTGLAGTEQERLALGVA